MGTKVELPAAPSPKRILVVEDEAALAETLRTWLERAGHEVCGLAAGVGDALALALAHRPHLAIVDVRLAGGEDGVVCARELERRAGTPALFWTAHPEAVKDGRVGIGHVAKPSGEREFLAAVDAAFAVVADAVPLHPPAGLRLHGTATAPAPVRRRRDAEFRALFDDAPHGIALVDRDGRLVEVNAACARFLLLDAAALEGRPVGELPCADAALAEALEACLTGRRDDIPPRETVALRADGRPVYASVSGVLVRRACGAPELVVLHVHDLSGLREAERVAQDFGEVDHRTGLASRNLFLNRVDRALARTRRMGTPFAVLLIDLDNFHELNAAYGLEVADAVIVAIADRIDDRRREVDTAARFAGDVYALLLEGTTPAGAMAVAHDVLGLIARPIDVAGVTVRATACVGVAYCSGSRLGPGAILERAEAALDRAKGRGCGQIVEAQR